MICLCFWTGWMQILLKIKVSAILNVISHSFIWLHMNQIFLTFYPAAGKVVASRYMNVSSRGPMKATTKVGQEPFSYSLCNYSLFNYNVVLCVRFASLTRCLVVLNHHIPCKTSKCVCLLLYLELISYCKLFIHISGLGV